MFSSATPGYTVTIPWWGILHKDGATASGANKFKHLEWHKPDNYYEFCRMSYGCVGAQITIAGYPTSFMDIYEVHRRNRSLNPTCVVLSDNQGGSTITVDNNDLFPVEPYYGEQLEYTKNGITYTDGKVFNGKCNIFYNDTLLWKTRTYKRGMEVKEISYYVPGGELEYVGYKKNGLIHGDFVSYYPNGEISISLMGK